MFLAFCYTCMSDQAIVCDGDGTRVIRFERGTPLTTYFYRHNVDRLTGNCDMQEDYWWFVGYDESGRPGCLTITRIIRYDKNGNVIGYYVSYDWFSYLRINVTQSPIESASIFPNPVKDYLIIKDEDNADNSNSIIELSDSFGNKIYSREMSSSGETIIPCASYSNGYYLLKIIKDNVTVFTQKVIINK